MAMERTEGKLWREGVAVMGEGEEVTEGWGHGRREGGG